MQTRKRTAILAKTDWLSFLDPDTVHLVLSHLRVDDMIEFRVTSRMNHDISLRIFGSRTLSVVRQAAYCGVQASFRRVSARAVCALRFRREALVAYTRLLRHTEIATPLVELGNTLLAAIDQVKLVALRLSHMLDEQRSLFRRYTDEGRTDELHALLPLLAQQLQPLKEELDRSEAAERNAKAAYEKAKAEMAAKLLVAFELSGDGGTRRTR